MFILNVLNDRYGNGKEIKNTKKLNIIKFKLIPWTIVLPIGKNIRAQKIKMKNTREIISTLSILFSFVILKL